MTSDQGELTATVKDVSSGGAQSRLMVLQVFVACMVPFFGIMNTWQAQDLQNKLQQLKQEADRKQQFAGSIQSQLNNLTGASPVKAKVALASLYTLAREESDKLILFTIAIVSQSKELKDTISTLVADDSNASQQFKKKIRLKLGKIVDPYDKTSSGVTGVAKVDLSAEKRLLEQLTQDQKNLSGWIYLGKAKQGLQQLADDKTIATPEIPRIRQPITTIISVNLRDAAATGRHLGRVQGILGQGTRATVEEVKRAPIDKPGNYDAVWAKVSVHDS